MCSTSASFNRTGMFKADQEAVSWETAYKSESVLIHSERR